MKVKVLATQSCLTLCNPMDYRPTRLLCSRNSPGKNTEVGSRSLLQRIFQVQGSNLGLLIASRFFTIQITYTSWPYLKLGSQPIIL